MQNVEKSKYPVRACLECGEQKRIIGRGLCGACYPRLKNRGELDAKYPLGVKGGRPSQRLPHEIKVAKLDKHPLELSALGLVEDKPDKVTPIRPPVIAEAVEKGAVIILKVTERDADLFAALQDWADDERRSIHNQVLHVLDKVVADRARGVRV